MLYGYNDRMVEIINDYKLDIENDSNTVPIAIA